MLVNPKCPAYLAEINNEKEALSLSTSSENCFYEHSKIIPYHDKHLANLDEGSSVDCLSCSVNLYFADGMNLNEVALFSFILLNQGGPTYS